MVLATVLPLRKKLTQELALDILTYHQQRNHAHISHIASAASHWFPNGSEPSL